MSRTVDDFGCDIAAMLKVLQLQMRDRGHTRAVALFRIESDASPQFAFRIWLRTEGEKALKRHGYGEDLLFLSGASVTEVFTAAHAAIREMDIASGLAAAPWFDWNAPINQPARSDAQEVTADD